MAMAHPEELPGRGPVIWSTVVDDRQHQPQPGEVVALAQEVRLAQGLPAALVGSRASTRGTSSASGALVLAAIAVCLCLCGDCQAKDTEGPGPRRRSLLVFWLP